MAKDREFRGCCGRECIKERKDGRKGGNKQSKEMKERKGTKEGRAR